MNLSQTRKVYNEDVISNGGYLYTGKRVYSACIATKKQTDEIHELAKKYVHRDRSRILDLGCGDGVYTLEMFESLHPKKIVGFDMAEEAIATAKKRISKKDRLNIHFEVGDVYTLSKTYKHGQFDLGVLRGVLHHLEHPQKAITQVSAVIDTVLVLEPNGFNPMMKIIEKVSSYHRIHGEKSYWPPALDQWFIHAGYHVVSKKYFSVVPYFCPVWLTKLLKSIEPFFESLPVVNKLYCGGILILYQK